MRFLWVSMIALAALCIAVFVGITRVMVVKSEETLTQVANLYMEEINTQLKRHFISLVEVHLARVEGITMAVPPSEVTQMDQAATNALTNTART